ncbi:MAG: hypothetical protein JW731_08205, partial [Bacteroidales bacterium]|nr:hypothetical protein [Bacteroidales bacterium]
MINHIMKKSITTSIFAFSLALSFAQTYHSGNITSNETWTAGTHIITSTVTVSDGVTLTIDPDCVVKFNSQTALIIDGVLISNGSDDHRIYFTSNLAVPAPGDWRNISFSSADPGCLMNYCEVEYGGYQYGSVLIHASETNVTISNSVLRNSGTAGAFISDNYGTASTPEFINCTFFSNATYGLDCVPGYSNVIL